MAGGGLNARHSNKADGSCGQRRGNILEGEEYSCEARFQSEEETGGPSWPRGVGEPTLGGDSRELETRSAKDTGYKGTEDGDGEIDTMCIGFWGGSLVVLIPKTHF